MKPIYATTILTPAVDGELAEIERTAQYHEVPVVPLVVDLVGNADSILTVLGQHLSGAPGQGGDGGLLALRLRAVPTLLSLDDTGRVLFVSNPMLAGSWPVHPKRAIPTSLPSGLEGAASVVPQESYFRGGPSRE